jgi:nucleotidyltransferase substrate binding protein (TIGR01987 family)
MALDYSPLKKALSSLKIALDRAAQHPKDNELRDACIQRFEYSFELCWKMLKRTLKDNLEASEDVDTYSKRDLFRVSAKYKLLEKPEPWFSYLEKRNLTTHTYDEKNAEEVFSGINAFYHDATYLLDNLTKTND